MPLRPSVVDIYLAAVNTTQGERSGPVGRILDLKNGVVTHYDPGQGLPRRIKVQQRNGFATLTTNGHSSTTGATETLAWTNPELLSTLGDQLLSIANAIPRVYDGTDWTHYGAERVVTNRLSESVFHTSQRTIQATDSAWSAGVTCSVWVETLGGEDPSVEAWVGFRSDDGTWIRVPTLLYAPGVPQDEFATMARVVADNDGLHFWVVFNALVSVDPVPGFFVALYDLNGQRLDFDDSVLQVWEQTPGYWDICRNTVGNGFHLAQPLHPADATTDGVRFSSFVHVAGVISTSTADNSDIHCRGPLAYITNDLGDDNKYLAVIGSGEAPDGDLWGYQLDALASIGHEFDFDASPPLVGDFCDSLIGFMVEGVEEGEPTMYVSFTTLATEQEIGPTWDPQLRFSSVYSCTWADVTTFIRQNNYTCQVSRAFLHDDEYYSINYYQGGSGLAVSSSQVEAVFTAGDYMIGEQLQAVRVQPGIDQTFGSPKTFLNIGHTNVTTPYAAINIDDTGTADKVELTTAAAAGFLFYPPDLALAKWTFQNINVVAPVPTGGILDVVGSSIPSANAQWVYIGGTGSVLYTFAASTTSTEVTPGTFVGSGGAGGTAEILSVTSYEIGPQFLTAYDESTKKFLPTGTIDVTGDPIPTNNGTFTIFSVWLESLSVSPFFNTVFVLSTTQVSSSLGGGTAEVTPIFPRSWVFSQDRFDDSLLVGPHTLIVENSEFDLNGTPVNNDSSGAGYSITDTGTTRIETDGDAITAQIFRSPVPKVTIRVPDDVTPFTFFLQDVDPDHTFLGATLVVVGDTEHEANNGVYTITGFDPDPGNHLIYAVPADGGTGQRSQMFLADDQLITIIFRTNVNASYQPCWLMVPLTGTKPVVGRFEYGLAFADWRFEGTPAPLGPNMFPLHVTSPVMGSDGWLWMLPYRAISFTVGQTLATTSGQIVNAAVTQNQSTVGTKQFNLSATTGQATASSTQLMLPGPMCGEFTASGFNENGVNFGFEAPFLVSQQESASASGAALRPNGSYQIVVVAEVTDEDSDRVYSIVSPPMNFTLSGDNNSATYGGRMLQPLSTAGTPVAQHYGVTNRKLLSLSIYRTAYQGDVPTTERHKITLDLNVNGLAPVSDTNASGFSFPNEFTWNYLDENLDAAILPNEIVYVDKGFLPRFPAPAQRHGVFWKNRSWVIGYDGAVWMSGEKSEGDAIWFFPGFRYVLPTTDKPVALAAMDDYLLVLCAKSLWYIPAGNFPNATGREGSLPTPVQLPFTNGCTGHALTLRDGVAYSSTAGGVWMITRSLQNIWLSQPVQDTNGETPVTSMTVDKRQRLHVAFGVGYLSVYDQVVQMWYSRWNLPTSDAHFLATVDGEVAVQEDDRVWLHDPATYVDRLTGSPVAIPIDVTLVDLDFATVRGLKSVWEVQLIGNYKGPHKINAVLSYPDDDPGSPTTFGPFLVDPTLPYLLAINPMIEQASAYGLRVFSSFEGIDVGTIGNTFELEIISCEVGLDSSVGLNKFPNGRRIEGR